MQVNSHSKSKQVAGIWVSFWSHGVTYAYAKAETRQKLLEVKKALEERGFEDVVIEPIMLGGSIVGWALSATQYPQE